LRPDMPLLDAFNNAQYNAMGDGVVSVDADGIVVLSDRISREKLDIYPGGSLERQFPLLWAKIKDTLSDRKPRFELSIQKGDSSFLVTVSPIIVDDQVAGAICVFVENTDLEIMARQIRSFRELSKELHDYRFLLGRVAGLRRRGDCSAYEPRLGEAQ
jgi:sensor histidine kinase regulating citrate/malate metabolism